MNDTTKARTQHTPGPWRPEMTAANAALIAAAPELLAALEVLTDHAQEQYPHFESERGQRDIAAALAAIARARGEEPSRG